MAARSSVSLAPRSRRTRLPVSQLRLNTAPQEGAMSLALALAGIREMHELDLVALYDLGGNVVASAGDGRAVEDLAPSAVRAARMGPERCAELFPLYGVVIDSIYLDGDVWIVAATTTAYDRDVVAIVNAVEEALEEERASAREQAPAPHAWGASREVERFAFALHLDDDELAVG